VLRSIHWGGSHQRGDPWLSSGVWSCGGRALSQVKTSRSCQLCVINGDSSTWSGSWSTV